MHIHGCIWACRHVSRQIHIIMSTPAYLLYLYSWTIYIHTGLATHVYVNALMHTNLNTYLYTRPYTTILCPGVYNMYAYIPTHSFADIDTYAHKCMHTYCKILLTGLCNSYVYTHTHTDVNRLNSRVTRSLLPWARLSERMKRFLKKTLKFKCFLRYYSVE